MVKMIPLNLSLSGQPSRAPQYQDLQETSIRPSDGGSVSLTKKRVRFVDDDDDVMEGSRRPLKMIHRQPQSPVTWCTWKRLQELYREAKLQRPDLDSSTEQIATRLTSQAPMTSKRLLKMTSPRKQVFLSSRSNKRSPAKFARKISETSFNRDVISSQVMRDDCCDYREQNSDVELPEDPRLWSKSDVRNWLEYMKSDGLDADRFRMNGKALCLMTQDMFAYRVPNGGLALYKDFQMRLCVAFAREHHASQFV